MHTRYLVVDQNYLRSEMLRDLVASDPGLHFVLPDMAMLEMTKSDRRELTVQLSLETLARVSRRVVVSRAMSECMKYELVTNRTVMGHMLNREATALIRKLLLAIATGARNEQYVRVVEDTLNRLPGLKRDYLDHKTNKSRALESVDALKREMSAEFASRVRGAKTTAEERISFVREKAPSILLGVLCSEYELSREKAVNFIRKAPMLLRYFYLRLWACLTWEEQGRLEGLGAQKVSNDLLDHEYVLAATFFDGVLSTELRVNEAYFAIKSLLAARV